MKKKMFLKVIALALMASLSLVAVCGCTSAEAGENEPAEAVEEEEIMEETVEPSVKAYAEWTVKEVAEFKEIVSGITNRQYAAGEGANHVIYEDISYDGEIVSAVQFSTASVRFDTVGEYGMTYWVYFDLAALTGWMEENGMEGTYDGLDSDADVLAVSVLATVTVTEAVEEDVEEEAEETADAEAAVSSANTAAASGGSASNNSSKSNTSSGGSSTKSGSDDVFSLFSKSSRNDDGTSKSNNSSFDGSNNSSKTECDHNWVEVMEEKNVYEGHYVCFNCGFTGNSDEIFSHCLGELSSYYYEKVVVGTETIGTGKYKCSKCGATK